MQIRRFYIPELTPADETTLLPPAEANHALRVLRLREGDRLQLLNGRGLVAEAELLNLGDARRPKDAPCRILSRSKTPAPCPALMLYVAPPRGKAFDLVLKAACELGFTAIQPILCTYGVARPEEISDGAQETLISALKQSANPWMPVLKAPVDFAAALHDASAAPGIFGASPAAEATPHQPLIPDTARATQCIWVGPEGGFAPQEESALLQAGVIPVTLGRCVLRVETAVPALAGCLYGLAALNS